MSTQCSRRAQDLQVRTAVVWNMANGQVARAVSQWHGGAAKLDSVGKIMYVDSRFSRSDNFLRLADRLSMAVSLEARFPFLDIELTQVAGIPSRMRIGRIHQQHTLTSRLDMELWPPARPLGPIGHRVDQNPRDGSNMLT
jgi:hypothetical protein